MKGICYKVLCICRAHALGVMLRMLDQLCGKHATEVAEGEFASTDFECVQKAMVRVNQGRREVIVERRGKESTLMASRVAVRPCLSVYAEIEDVAVEKRRPVVIVDGHGIYRLRSGLYLKCIHPHQLPSNRVVRGMMHDQ